jgi:hypothetical protein
MSVLGALCAFMASFTAHPVEIYSAESVKAAFVLRFAGYVRWPDEAVPAEKFTIAVLDANEVAQHLQSLLGRRLLLDRPVQVRRITEIRDARDAQILYVGRRHAGDLRPLLAPLGRRSVLVITDEEDALAATSTINLLVADQRVRFEISLANARRVGLDISSDLLALAVRVLE